MTSRGRRRRALLLLSLALASGGLAASEVQSRLDVVDARVGRPIPVVVASKQLRAGAALTRSDLAVEEVPARFVPPDALASPAEAQGGRPLAPIARGAYVTAGQIAGPSTRRPDGRLTLRQGERAVEVAVSAAEGIGAGARVDVLVATEAGAGSGRALLALEDVELLGLRPGGVSGASDGNGGAGATASAVATLRVTLRQAVYLTAAQSFAREVRLLGRPPGDRERLGREMVRGGEL